MAACIKMPLGMELGLSPGDFVLDEDPDPQPAPKFSAHVYYSYCDFVRTLHSAQCTVIALFKFKCHAPPRRNTLTDYFLSLA